MEHKSIKTSGVLGAGLHGETGFVTLRRAEGICSSRDAGESLLEPPFSGKDFHKSHLLGKFCGHEEGLQNPVLP